MALKLFKHSFSLVEFLYVLTSVSKLCAIISPQYINTIEKVRAYKAQDIMNSMRCSMDRFWYEERAASVIYNNAVIELLDIDNPNNDDRRLYNYTLRDKSTILNKKYEILAERIDKKATLWLRWVQLDKITGRLYKSKALSSFNEEKI